MQAMAANLKEQLHALDEQLPPNATWKDVLYEAYIRQEIKAGVAEAKRGEFAADKDVKSAFAKWGVQIETEVDATGSPPAR